MKLATLSGINVYIHWSFWILPVWIGFSVLGGGGGLLAAASAVGMIGTIFGCVVLHEMGHALAARHFGIGTRDITLYPIGGVANLERIPAKPFQELVIAVAGPLVNVAIAAAVAVVFAVDAGIGAAVLHPFSGGFLTWLLAINVWLVLFNLIPAFPMDGGRVLRAVLAMVLPYRSATRIAGRIGQGLAVTFGLLGLFSGSWNLVIIAAFVFLVAAAEINRVTRIQPSYLAEPATVDLSQPAAFARTPDAGNQETAVIWLGPVRHHVYRDSNGRFEIT